MDNSDKIQLVQDSAANILKVVREKTDLERFWSGIKISCIFIALVRNSFLLKQLAVNFHLVIIIIKALLFIHFQLLSIYNIILVRQLNTPMKEEQHDIFNLHEEVDPINDWFLDLEPKIEKLLSTDFPIVDCFRNRT